MGICPDAEFSTFSNYGGYSPAEAIQIAADMLDPGDILILEMHRPGPRHGFTARGDQRGYVAVEWWPLDFAAVRYAVSRGILVLSAAGNGAEDLDDARYNVRPAGFPPAWSNPFRRGTSDSGSIIVGAGAPPPGTHGRNHGPARARLEFSNYGGLVDAQGWGREVTTCGYGDLQGGHDENLWYTDAFSGTSSATPIVAGALACVQGIRRASAKSPLTPAQARALLRDPATGSPQQDGPIVGGVVRFPRTERIGGLPDLSRLIPAALALP
jgi:subtilisin family serine protease